MKCGISQGGEGWNGVFWVCGEILICVGDLNDVLYDGELWLGDD